MELLRILYALPNAGGLLKDKNGKSLQMLDSKLEVLSIG
jgi:hypothetical protein